MPPPSAPAAPDATWAGDIPGVVLEELRGVALLSSYGGGGGGGGGAPARRAPAGGARRKPRAIPISRPSTAPGACVSVPADQAPLFPVSAEGLPPTLETIRATERLVAAVATSNRAAADAKTFDDGAEGGGLGAQYTQGVVGKPMSAQEAWAHAVDGEARQQEIVSSMAARSAELFQSTMAQLAI